MKEKETLAILAGANFIEFYDLMLFVSFQQIIYTKFLFILNDSITFSWIIFIIAYLSRPLGSAVIGLYGDGLSRKKALIISISGISLGTMAISFLPGAEKIGLWAPCLLIFFRFIQGFCIGGENNGAAIFLFENCSLHPITISLVIISSTFLGGLLSSLISSFSIMQKTELWRLTFFFGGALGFVLLYFRKMLFEKTDLQKSDLQYNNCEVSFNIFLKQCKLHSPNMMQVILFSGINGCICYFSIGYFTSVASENLNLDKSSLNSIIFFTALVASMFQIAFSRYYAHKSSKPNVLKPTLLSIFIICAISNTTCSDKYILIPMLSILGGLMAYMGGALHLFAAGSFPKSIRYFGASLSFSLGMAIFGSTTPFICYKIYEINHSLALFAGYYSFLCIAFLISIYFTKAKNIDHFN